MNYAAITRRIRRCENEEAAQIVLEHAIKEEREACARVCESASMPIDLSVWRGTRKELTAFFAKGVATLVRERGVK